MERKSYIAMLIFCGVLSLGTGTSEKNEISSDLLLLRKKRIVDRTSRGSTSMSIELVPYMVNIQRDNDSICGGSILTPNNILTAAHCLVDAAMHYRVLSGSKYKNRGTPHKIIKKIVHPGFVLSSYKNDLALIVISPPIDFIHSPNRGIQLYNGSLPSENPYGTFTGWGCCRIIMGKKLRYCELQSTNLPIISQQACQYYYLRSNIISNQHICTLERNGGKGCSFGDSGGPLVLHGKLLGVLSWTREIAHPHSPDVFVNIANPEYNHWIRSNIIYVH